MRNTICSLGLLACLNACNFTPQQGLQGLQVVGGMSVHADYLRQSQRLCAQKADPASRFQCEQEAQKEFLKFQKQIQEKP